MFEIFNVILQMSLKASIVIIAILIMRQLLKKAPRKFSYMLWSVAAFRLLTPFSFKSVFSIFRFTENVTSNATTYTTSYTNTTPTVPQTPQATGTPTFSIPNGITAPSYNYREPIEDISQAVTSSPSIQIPTEPTVSENVVEEFDFASFFENAISWIWLVGVAFLLIYGIVSFIKLKRKMDTAILYDKNIYFSDRISSPFTLGFFKPRIYLPFGLSDTEIKCILAHEKAHIQRLDHIIKPFAYILLAVHWFNPLCWIAFNRMTFDMEMSCDEAVLSKSNDCELKKNYSKTLLALASQKRFPAMSPIAFNDGGNAKTRIKHALYWKKPKIWISVVALILCIATLVACMSDALKNIYDFGDVPYKLEYTNNGYQGCYVSNIITDFEHDESFEIVIPEKSPEGDFVIGIKIDQKNSLHNFENFNVPKYILAEDMNELTATIKKFDGEHIQLFEYERSSERAALTLSAFYMLKSKEVDGKTVEYYLIDEHLTKEEHDQLSKLLSHYAEYDTEKCFDDAEKCLEALTDDEENADNLKADIFSFFYHSAKNISKIKLPEDVKSIDDGIRDELDFEILYEYADSGKKFENEESEKEYEIIKKDNLTIKIVDEDYLSSGDFDVYVDNHRSGNNLDIVITVGHNITDIAFFEINPDYWVKDDQIIYEIENVLYFINDMNNGDSFGLSTYIGDVVTERGIVTSDAEGNMKYYSIDYNMSGIGPSLTLKEFIPYHETGDGEITDEVWLWPTESPFANDEYINYFIDPKNGSSEDAEVIEFIINDPNVDRFTFFELIQNDGYELGEVLLIYYDGYVYENKDDRPEYGWHAFIKTLITEGEPTRAISYIDANGKQKCFGIYSENEEYVMKEIECRNVETLTEFLPYFYVHEQTDIEIDQVWYFDENVVVVNNREGFFVVDTNGNVLSDIYELIYPFKDGKAFAYDKERNAYYLNTKGEVIKKLNEDEIREYFSYLEHDTKIYRTQLENGEQRYGIAKDDDTPLTETIFEFISSCDLEYNFAILADGHKPVFIDKEGNILQYLPEGLVQAYRTDKHIYGSYSESEWCLFDTNGHLLNETRFVDIGSFENGIATVVQNDGFDKIGVIDENGNIIVVPCIEGYNNDAVDICNGKIAYYEYPGRLVFADIILEEPQSEG